MADLVAKILDCLLSETTPKPDKKDADILHSFFAKRSANDSAVASQTLTLILGLARRDNWVSELQQDVIERLINSFDEAKDVSSTGTQTADTTGELSGTTDRDIDATKPLPTEKVKENGEIKEAIATEAPTARATMDEALAELFPAQGTFKETNGEVTGTDPPNASDGTIIADATPGIGDTMKPAEMTSKPIKLEPDSPAKAKAFQSEVVEGIAQTMEYATPKPTPKQASDKVELFKPEHSGASNGVGSANGVGSTKDVHGERAKQGTPKVSSRRLPHEWNTPIPEEELQRMASTHLDKSKLMFGEDDAISAATWGGKTPPHSEYGGDAVSSRRQSLRPSDSNSQDGGQDLNRNVPQPTW